MLLLLLHTGNQKIKSKEHFQTKPVWLFVLFRMNFAQIRSYEADVGTKTTHHVMYPESAVDLDNTTHLVLFPFKIQDMEWLMKARTTGFYGR